MVDPRNTADVRIADVATSGSERAIAMGNFQDVKYTFPLVELVSFDLQL
jgi:hypothetical protein